MEPGTSPSTAANVPPNRPISPIQRRRSTGDIDMPALGRHSPVMDRTRYSADGHYREELSECVCDIAGPSQLQPSPMSHAQEGEGSRPTSPTSDSQRMSRLHGYSDPASTTRPSSDSEFERSGEDASAEIILGESMDNPTINDLTGQNLPNSAAITTPPSIIPNPPSNPPRLSSNASRPRLQQRGFRGYLRKLLLFLGFGPNNRARKEIVSLVWNVSFNFVQFVVTLTLVIYSGFHRSPQDHSISEWTACDKPLGAWNSVWIAKTVFDCLMTYWGFRRDRKVRLAQERQRNDPEAQQERQAARNANVEGNDDVSDRASSIGGQERRRAQSLPFTKVYSKLSLLLSLLLITWFLTANSLVYTSIHTCRFTAPHLWWLTFGILCIHYFMIVEVFLIAIFIFIVGPLIYLFWNIFLMCLGRHPLQNPYYINPEIGKLPKSVVEQIPLVLYIPPPPGDETKDVIPIPTPVHLKDLSLEHTYPPKPSPPVPKRRFTFLRMRSSKSAVSTGDVSVGVDEKLPDSESSHNWEDHWERGEYPFVRLEGNRASCAICLMDFEEPKRLSSEVIKLWANPSHRPSADVPKDVRPEDTQSTHNSARSPVDEGGAEVSREILEVPTTEEGPSNELRLEDAGQGAQPLRLLPCGHVFHKTCIDPWLHDVSGRCPTCQRPVVIPKLPKKKKRQRNQ